MKNMKGIVSLSSAVRRSAGGNGSSSGRPGRPRSASGGSRPVKPAASPHNVFIAPSPEGGDVEYKKLISGKVDNNKPSFA
ncbi:hypothetical protein C2I18_08595 [Paenibacillus sp. PK3_47]|uniref:hypothetical protein n=1 Tax=Paenibacillus sp. PK3_47 TaxID=2072642 RepID=UPI00201D343A|nr:hypothetical protein [Paenibacillus sp. PK3_47]UQZ33597.1 hypothetical protein C2I18_08595 [Paenibacillus sp. PK3_47]